MGLISRVSSRTYRNSIMKVILFTAGLGLLSCTSAFKLSEKLAKSALKSKADTGNYQFREEYCDQESSWRWSKQRKQDCRRRQVERVTDTQQRWSSICHFDAVYQWERFQSDMERANIPEFESNSLDRCAEQCVRDDSRYQLWNNEREESWRYQGNRNQGNRNQGNRNQNFVSGTRKPVRPDYEQAVMEQGSLDNWRPACEKCFKHIPRTFTNINNFNFSKNCTPQRFQPVQPVLQNQGNFQNQDIFQNSQRFQPVQPVLQNQVQPVLQNQGNFQNQDIFQNPQRFQPVQPLLHNQGNFQNQDIF